MSKKYDVTALGELLIDFTQNGMSSQGNLLYEANPGGAPCNVLAMLRRLGDSTAFIGKVGDDMFGRQLKQTIGEAGIDTAGLMMDGNVRTTLAFVQTFEDGDRDFSFYRNPGADMMLRKEEIDTEMIKDSRIFHFGTLSMTDEPVRSATIYALETAKENDILVSFDPNLREPLWKSLDEAKAQVRYGLTFCDVLKISDNEIQWLTGIGDYNEGVRRIQDEFDIPLILLSMGKDGSRAFYGDRIVEGKPFLQENTIETTGAGDTFFGSCLHFILEYGTENLRKGLITDGQLEEMLTFANAAASIITTRKGALRVMPAKEEVIALTDQDK